MRRFIDIACNILQISQAFVFYFLYDVLNINDAPKIEHQIIFFFFFKKAHAHSCILIPECHANLSNACVSFIVR